MKKTIAISITAGFALCGLLMAAVLNGWLDVPLITAPANPGSGWLRFFASSATGKLACLDSAGASCLASGSGAGWNAQQAMFSSIWTGYNYTDISGGGVTFNSTGAAGYIHTTSITAFTAGTGSVVMGMEFTGQITGQNILLFIRDGGCTGTNPGAITFYFNFDTYTSKWGVGAWQNKCDWAWNADQIANQNTSLSGIGALRIREASGTRYFEVSADSLGRGGWSIVGSHSTGTYITPTQTGWQVNVGSGAQNNGGIITRWDQL